MDDVKKIMVALALSEDSEGIYNYAANIAQIFNAELENNLLSLLFVILKGSFYYFLF